MHLSAILGHGILEGGWGGEGRWNDHDITCSADETDRVLTWDLGKGVVVGEGGWKWNNLDITCSADETDRVLRVLLLSRIANVMLESVVLFGFFFSS
ncbi:hypothetical protein CDAR_248831 [Caerostris darwini]|uniref:Uncharacterized protein n=1 Tax=Caerostris darwini TaxID=1538125 RepID=A0AAV4VK91_9ARAC|nr:hypothetical protein CDAR_248831 [Caerostris darwini]